VASRESDRAPARGGRAPPRPDLCRSADPQHGQGAGNQRAVARLN